MKEKAEKERIDLLLVNKGLCKSREAAKALIMSGDVFVNGQRIEKPGTNVETAADIKVKEGLKYVSRGGFKLEKAINCFGIGLNGKICIDIGASTGGFTDCMLQNGAELVYAVDVGYGQLDWKLRNHERVIVYEKTNARYLDNSIIDKSCGFATVDVSFISLEKILPAIQKILSGEGEAVCLIKPQFECGRKYVGKKGVVKEKFVHEYVINKVIEYGETNRLLVKGLTYSPIKGPNGNIEYLIYLGKNCQKVEVSVQQTVKEAHGDFERNLECSQK